MVSMAPVLYVLYGVGITIFSTSIGLLVWWMLDQRRSWFLRYNRATGKGRFFKDRVKRDRYVFSDEDGNQASIDLDTHRTIELMGWRGGKLFVIEESTATQKDMLDRDSKESVSLGWMLGALAQGRLGEEIMRSSGHEDKMMTVLIIVGVVVVIGFVVMGIALFGGSP